MSDSMRRSWLVQRLNKPRASSVFGKDNPFAFGGGLANGGLSAEAMNLLRPIFGFDYMGAAEFEFGAVPKALEGLAKDAKRLVARDVAIDLSLVPPSWQDRKSKPLTGTATLYLLARKSQADEAAARIAEWAAGNEELKERTDLARTLRPFNEWDGETQGWLELDNGFLFFADREMFAATAALFGVKVKAEAA